MLKLLTSPLAGVVGLVLSLLLAGALVFSLVSKNNEISQLTEDLRLEKASHQLTQQDLTTSLGNQMRLEGGLNSCNASVAAVAAQREALTKAGTAAINSVRSAGAAASRAAAIAAMPTATCEDAFAILKEGGK